MFTDNRYTRIYNQIIERRVENPPDGYSERHHIIPKSLGGSNNARNLVRLSAREHYLCHRLLPRMVAGEAKAKMLHALWCLVNGFTKNERHLPPSHVIAFAREQHAKQVGEQFSGAKSEAHRKAISESLMGKSFPRKSPSKLRGKKRSPEAVAKTAAAHVGMKRSEATKLKLRQAWIIRRSKMESALGQETNP